MSTTLGLNIHTSRRARLTGSIVALSCALAVAVGASSAEAGTNQVWIDTARVNVPGLGFDGSYAQSPDLQLQTINPYWTSYTIVGLAGNGGKNRAWEWAGWYRDHMMVDPSPTLNGTVYQFTLDPVPLSDPVEYTQIPLYGAIPADVAETDSASAHAATFLIALGATYAADSKVKKLEKVETALVASVELLQALQDPLDGLIWSLPPAADRPGDPRARLKLLVTQGEAFAGLRSAGVLADALGDPVLAATARVVADRIAVGVATLWDPFNGAYALSKHENGVLVPMDWNNWYPDAIAQAGLVAAGNWLSPDNDLVPAANASNIMDEFTATGIWPEWTNPAFVPSGSRLAGTGSGALDYQPLIAAAFAAEGRWATDGLTGITAMNSYADTAGRPWPFTIGNAGQIMALLGDV